MRAVLALDLDQTLIYSARSAGRTAGTETVWVEDYEGAPLSLMTARAHQRLAALTARHDVVPVTTRTAEQFLRVRLPGDLPRAVCCNGGVLLVDGVRDPAWDARVAHELSQVAPAGQVAAWVRNVASHDWVKTVREVEELFVYLVAHRRDQIPADWLSSTTAWAATLGWRVSLQGRKVYVVPEQLSKGAAAGLVADRLGGPLLAAGDSLLDRCLLERAVFAVRPAHGELHEIGYQREGLHVTAQRGARAAEELLEVLETRADALTAVRPAAAPA